MVILEHFFGVSLYVFLGQFLKQFLTLERIKTLFWTVQVGLVLSFAAYAAGRHLLSPASPLFAAFVPPRFSTTPFDIELVPPTESRKRSFERRGLGFPWRTHVVEQTAFHFSSAISF